MKFDLYKTCAKTLETGKETINYIVKIKEVEKYITPYFDNKYNFAYGYSGIIYGLNELGMKIPNSLIDQLYTAILCEDSITSPISLTRGSIAALITLYQYDSNDKLKNKIRELLNAELSKLLNRNNENYSLFNGISGIGFLALIMFENTRDNCFWTIAQIVYNQIVVKSPLMRSLGLAYGNTGIALFLLHYGKYHKTNKVFRFAKFYILYDIKVGQMHNDRNGFRGIRNIKNENIPYIYIPYGTAGIFKTIIKYLNLKEDSGLIKELSHLYNSFNIQSTLQSGYLLGTSGIISCLLDYIPWSNFNRDVFKTLTILLKSLLSTKIQTNGKILFPADQNMFPAVDYGSGEMGVLLTLNKLITGKEYDPLFK